MRCNSLLGYGLLSLGLLACRSDGGGGNTGDDDDTHPDTPAKTKIQDVQNDAMPPGTAVSLSGVIVTAIDAFGPKTGDFWVEEPEGGPFSGVHVFGAAASDVALLKVGDIVSITGAVKDEFALTSDTSGRTTTELENPQGSKMVVTKTGNGVAPDPVMIDVLAIGQLATQAERDAEWEKWEGVLITAPNVGAFGAPKCINSGGVCDVAAFASFSVTGDAKAENQLAAFPADVKLGDCFSKVTGVVDYFFDYLIFPRDTSEMVTGGTDCAVENAAIDGALCTDGLDNDGNGFIDCADFSCSVGAHAWLGATCTAADATCGCSTNLPDGTSVNKVNTTNSTGIVLMHDVFVTGVAGNGYWVADSATAAANGGVFVFTSTPPAGIVVGQNLATVQGSAAPFNSSTTGTLSIVEVSNPTAGTVVSTGATIVPITSQTAETLAGATTGATFAGSIVKLTNLKVKTTNDNFGHVVLVDNANKTIVMDDAAFGFYGGTKTTPTTFAVGTCFASVTGLMSADTHDPQVRTINPRTADDMPQTGGACTGALR